MLKNYFKIAFRNLTRNRFISFINIFGLTVGLSCCFLISIYIINELSYDKQHPNAENIYRVTRIFRNAETGVVSLHLSALAPPFTPLLQSEFPEIKKITRVLSNGITTMRYGDKMFNEDKAFYAEENIFDFFKINLKQGNPQTLLSEPFNLVLSEELAKKYFGDEEPLDKVIKFNNGLNGKVTGVFEAFPPNSHFHPTMLISFSTLRDSAVYGAENLETNFGNNSFYTYILTPDEFDPKKLETKFPAFLDKHVPSGPQFKASAWTALTLQKLTDIHLHSHLADELEENGDIKRIYIFSAIALFVLFIACINYMNLATARSALRAREIGIRKVIGAERREIIAQFLSESVLITWLALLIAFALTQLALPWLNILSGQQLSIGLLNNWKIISLIIIAPFIVGIISGLYPALFMSAFQPIKVLKGIIGTGGTGISFRKVLVTAQFAISIILIISTVVVAKQMRYIQNRNLGYDKNHIINLNYITALNDKFDSFRNELTANSSIKSVGRSSRIPTGRLLDSMGAKIKSGDSLAPITTAIKFLWVDDRFIDTYGIKIVAGREFSKTYSTDSSSFILNQSAVKALGFKSEADAIGADFGYGSVNGKIIGIYQDFHFESLHEEIVPLVFLMPSSPRFNIISVKIAGNNIPATLAHVENVWNSFLPEVPFQYSFLDERFSMLYQSEEKQKTIFTIFAFIAIFIACLGLFGLTAFAISQRIKEIGIRKVLGASITNIVTLFSKDFLKLVLIAAFIAFPIAWLVMNKWLQDFAYKTVISWEIFLIAGICATGIAFLTISLQTIKAANTNPVKNLRTE